MKMKRLFSLLTVGLVLIVLAACGQKSTEDTIKTELKDSYVGHSVEPGGVSPFNSGNDVLTFNKKNNSITNNQGDMKYFSIVSADDISSDIQQVLEGLETQLKGTNNFTIIVSREKNPKREDSEGIYQIALSDGGKTIRIFELGRDQRSYGYYDFSGKAE